MEKCKSQTAFFFFHREMHSIMGVQRIADTLFQVGLTIGFPGNCLNCNSDTREKRLDMEYNNL